MARIKVRPGIRYSLLIAMFIFLLTSAISVFAEEPRTEKGYTYSFKRLIEEAKKTVKKIDDELEKEEIEKRNRQREAMVKEHFEKGETLYREGKPKEAKKELLKAIRITKDPEMKTYIRNSERRMKEEELARKKEERERQRRLDAESKEKERLERERQQKLEAEEREKRRLEAKRAREEELARKKEEKRLEAERKKAEKERIRIEKEEIRIEKERQREKPRLEREKQRQLQAEQREKESLEKEIQRKLKTERREKERLEREKQRKLEPEERKKARLEQKKQRQLEAEQREKERLERKRQGELERQKIKEEKKLKRQKKAEERKKKKEARRKKEVATHLPYKYKTRKECLDVLGRNPKDKKTFNNLVELYRLVNKHLKKGKNLYKKQKWNEAITEYRKALAIEPGNKEAIRFIKKANAKLKRLKNK